MEIGLDSWLFPIRLQYIDESAGVCCKQYDPTVKPLQSWIEGASRKILSKCGCMCGRLFFFVCFFLYKTCSLLLFFRSRFFFLVVLILYKRVFCSYCSTFDICWWRLHDEHLVLVHYASRHTGCYLNYFTSLSPSPPPRAQCPTMLI